MTHLASLLAGSKISSSEDHMCCIISKNEGLALAVLLWSVEFPLLENLLPRPKEAVVDDSLPKHLLSGWRSCPVQLITSP